MRIVNDLELPNIDHADVDTSVFQMIKLYFNEDKLFSKQSNGTVTEIGSLARSIVSISRTSGNGAAGTVDTYTIEYNSEPTQTTYQVTNGQDGINGSAVEVRDEGTLLTNSTSGLNFVGGGVVATVNGSAATITIEGNSNAFANVLVNGTNLAAEIVLDTLTLTSTNGVTIVGTASTDSINVSLTDTPVTP